MLKLIVLNGELQGSETTVYEGMTIGNHDESDIILSNSDKFEILCDSSGSFSLKTESKKSLIDLGGELHTQIEILPGIIFSIGEIGFSVQEGEAAVKNSKSSTFKVLDFFKDNEKEKKKIFPIITSLSLEFVRGTLLNSIYEVPWHPFTMGSKSNLSHFIDEHLQFDDDILILEQAPQDESINTILTPSVSNFISINKQLISKPTVVNHGDLVEFSETAFYIKIK